MIRMIVTYRCKDGQRNAFLNALSGANIATTCQNEKGCLQYHYFLPADSSDANTLLLLEKWETAEDLKAHTETAHFKAIGAMKDLYVDAMDIEHHISE